jgi:hypothetical protein
MVWIVELHEDFELEVEDFDKSVRRALLAATKVLADFGPDLGRPFVDSLKGSKHSNMKELRFEAADGEWRAAFAFDPERKAMVLVAGDKSGVKERRFYKRLIAIADQRFSAHVQSLRAIDKGK